MSEKKTAPDPVKILIEQLLEAVKTNPDTRAYDDRVIPEIKKYLENDDFFNIPVELLNRYINESHCKLDSTDAFRILYQTFQAHGDESLQLLLSLDLGNISGGEVMEALEALDKIPIIRDIVDHQDELLAPSPEKNLREQANEKLCNQKKNAILIAHKRYMDLSLKENILRDQIAILEQYKHDNPYYGTDSAALKKLANKLEEKNKMLILENQKWKTSAVENPLLKPFKFIDDIFKASEEGDSDSVYYLVENNPALANSTKEEGFLEVWTPLFYAIKNGHMDVVKILVEHGADVNRRESLGTPLAFASRSGFENIENYLIEHGATRT